MGKSRKHRNFLTFYRSFYLLLVQSGHPIYLIYKNGQSFASAHGFAIKLGKLFAHHESLVVQKIARSISSVKDQIFAELQNGHDSWLASYLFKEGMFYRLQGYVKLVSICICKVKLAFNCWLYLV